MIRAVDRYVSDFGTFTASLWPLLRLRKRKRKELANPGNARKFHGIGDATLESGNEAGNGIVAVLL